MGAIVLVIEILLYSLLIGLLVSAVAIIIDSIVGIIKNRRYLKTITTYNVIRPSNINTNKIKD